MAAIAMSEFPVVGIEERRETHLSIVYLTENYAFKLKKPVNLGFADFSTFTKRWRAICREVALNRRLASGVYLGITCLREHAAGYSIGKKSCIRPLEELPPTPEEGNEAAVVMRRLKESWRLDHLLRTGAVSVNIHIRPLLSKLFHFHRQYVLPYLDPQEYCSATIEMVRDNFRSCENLNASRVLPSPAERMLSELKDWAERTFAVIGSTLALRVRQDRIVDGHGDLRLEHIYFEPSTNCITVQIIDCLEFSRGLRRCDVASDIAFLAMDLDRYEQAALARIACNEYVALDEDQSFHKILPFFKAYRAMVRSKVHLTRATQLGSDNSNRATEIHEAVSYLGLAFRYARGITGPLLIVLCGTMGSGKSSVANKLRSLFNGVVFSSDKIRKEACPNSDITNYGEGIYEKSAKRNIYTTLCAKAKFALMNENIVILDASFIRLKDRELAYEVASACGSRCVVVETRATADEALKRIRDRLQRGDDASQARPEYLQHHISEWEPISRGESAVHCIVDTEKDVDEQIFDILKKFTTKDIQP